MLNFYLILGGYGVSAITTIFASAGIEDCTKCFPRMHCAHSRFWFWLGFFLPLSYPAFGSLASAGWGLALYKNRDFDICTDSFLHSSGTFLHIYMIIAWVFVGIFGILGAGTFWLMWEIEHASS